MNKSGLIETLSSKLNLTEKRQLMLLILFLKALRTN